MNVNRLIKSRMIRRFGAYSANLEAKILKWKLENRNWVRL